MTAHQLGPLIPGVTTLFIVLSSWNMWRMRRLYRRRGRQAVERLLASRGEALVAIKALPVSSQWSTAGLTTTLIFQVVARTPQGAEQTHEWAYERRIFPWQSEGLKRLAHGIWIPAA